MELLFGSRVRSGNRRAGYLAGVEVEPASRRVTKIIFSDDGKLGSQAQTRAIDAVRVEGRSIVAGEAGVSGITRDPLVWSRAIRLVRDGREAGHLSGVVLGAQGAIEAVLGRHHWWRPGFRMAGADLDLSAPGEIRGRATTVQAA